jgi:hypothetical protein
MNPPNPGEIIDMPRLTSNNKTGRKNLLLARLTLNSMGSREQPTEILSWCQPVTPRADQPARKENSGKITIATTMEGIGYRWHLKFIDTQSGLKVRFMDLY